jgi:hypothetical protein
MKSGSSISLRGSLVTQIGRLVEGELEPDRVDRHDGGQKGGIATGAAGHQIAGGNPAVTDAAGHRGLEFGELEIEHGLVHGGILGLYRSFGDALGLRPLIEGLLGDGLVADQLLPARQIGFRECKIGLRLRQIGFGLIERGLERPLVDGEKKVTLLDELAILEMHVIEIARDARTHLDRIDGHKAADVFVLIDDGPLHRLGDGHRGWWRRCRLVLAVAATGKDNRRNQPSGSESGAHCDGHGLRSGRCRCRSYIEPVVPFDEGCRGAPLLFHDDVPSTIFSGEANSRIF